MSRNKTVLVMEDEEMIRSRAAAMLSELGCTPVTWADGAEAVKLYRESMELNQPFAAVILDMTVPGGMGGTVAAEKIRALDPDAVLIISSGYGTDTLLDTNGVNLFDGAIKKPYNMSQFARVIGCVPDPA
ncbi:response regulator [bacterium]|nr:MAG: response regulator [bacterium]